MTKRKSELSLLNIFMCLSVIFIHVLSWTITDMDRSTVQYIFMLVPWRLLQFVVQGFIFLSALKLFSSKRETDYEAFLVGRYKKIVLPYVLWVIIYYAYFILTYGYKFSFAKLGEYLVFGTICSHFYFIVIIMQFYLNLPLFKWIFTKVNAFLLAAVSVLLTALFKQYVFFQYDDRVLPAYLCYFVIGAAVGKNYDKVKAAVKKYFMAFAVLFAVSAFGDAFLTYRAQVHGITFRFIETVHIIYCISAIFFFLGLFLFFEGRKLPRLLALIDRSSYLIYLCHVLFIYMANALAPKLGIVGMTECLLFRFVFAFGATLVFSMGYTALTERIKNGKQIKSTLS